MAKTEDMWPGGVTWVVQGTVVSDATGGTHVATLVVTPGAGNEMELLYGQIVNTGAAAIAAGAVITDGTNNLTVLQSQTTASTWLFPVSSSNNLASAGARYLISGTMTLKLNANTSTVSQTQTFAVVVRMKTGGPPTCTLADSVGTPTLTLNTNKPF